MAFFLIVRKMLRKGRRTQQQQQQQYQTIGELPLRQQNFTSNDQDNDGSMEIPNLIAIHENDGLSNDSMGFVEHNSETNLSFSPTIVASLTVLGALDEVSYFPGLLVGHIFSPLDLCLGTALAASIIVILVTFCLSHCRPLLDCLDRIPLYGVLCGFATLLSVDAIWDYKNSTSAVP
jgi:hypothetical protein